jgi:hypothetical protein
MNSETEDDDRKDDTGHNQGCSVRVIGCLVAALIDEQKDREVYKRWRREHVDSVGAV